MSLTRRTKDEKSFQNVQNLIKRRGEENFSDGVKIPFTTRVPHTTKGKLLDTPQGGIGLVFERGRDLTGCGLWYTIRKLWMSF